MIDSPTLIIDCHAICHALKHTIGDLSYEEQKVGVVFGFLKKLLSLSKEFNSNSFIFCWDSKKSYRRDIYPDYKKRKPISSDELNFERFAFKQFVELRIKTLPLFGFKNNFIQTGLEADDIIAVITQNYVKQFIIVSGDNDLYQLLSDSVSIYQPKKKKYITQESFAKEFDISSTDWAKVKQIAGCRSDTVEGIAGVAEKTAIKFLTGKLGTKTKVYDRIINGQYIINRNEALVRLPFINTKIPKISETEMFYVSNLIKVVDRYGFNSFLSTEVMNDWIVNFKMR